MQDYPRKQAPARPADVAGGGKSRSFETSPGRSALSASTGNPLADVIAFARGFVAHPRQVGSIVPSSTALTRRVVNDAGVDRARVVVELGPGTGGTTRALLAAMPAHASLLAVELSSTFHARLSRQVRDRRLAIECGDAVDLLGMLARHRLPPPDAIVSGIPFSTIPAESARASAPWSLSVSRPAGGSWRTSCAPMSRDDSLRTLGSRTSRGWVGTCLPCACFVGASRALSSA